MPPQNVAEMLDNSNLDATWEKFVKYLTRFKFLAVGKIENLSLPQLKTIYNLNFKHNEVIFSIDFSSHILCLIFSMIFMSNESLVCCAKMQFDEFYVTKNSTSAVLE